MYVVKLANDREKERKKNKIGKTLIFRLIKNATFIRNLIRFQSLCLAPSVDCLHCVWLESETKKSGTQNFENHTKEEKKKNNISMQGQIGKSPIM